MIAVIILFQGLTFLLRNAAARSDDEFRDTIAETRDAVTLQECGNYLAAAGDNRE